jgi:hypothetical protein
LGLTTAGLTILTNEAEIGSINGKVLLAFEHAPDSEVRLLYDELLNMGSMPHPDSDLREAHELSRKLLKDLPEFEGVRLLEVFEQIVVEELAATCEHLRLHDWIASQGFKSCRFTASSSLRDRLDRIQREVGHSYEITDASVGGSTSRKLTRHIIQNGISANGLSNLVEYGFRRILPQVSRFIGARLKGGRKSLSSGGAWFYSSSYNCSSIGLAYQPFLGKKLRFVYEDPDTGGRRLREAGRDATNLYWFAEQEDLLRPSEVSITATSLSEAISAVQLSGKQEILRNVFVSSPKFQYILTRMLALAMFQTRVVRRFLNDVNPDLAIVGNAVWETPLLVQARARGIPTVLLQHGLVHQTLAVADQPVDQILVRGEFFQQQLCPRLRDKSVVLNYPSDSQPSKEPRNLQDGAILYLTAPYHQLPSYHLADRNEILGTLIATAAAARRQLIIRVHPLETILEYRHFAEELATQKNLSVKITYSQGAGLDSVLQSSAVAILHFSTVFLDCMRFGIPVISFDWHSFPFKEQYREQKVFHFATDLSDLKQLVRKGLGGELVSGTGIERFLRPTKPDEIRRYFDAKTIVSTAN